MRVNITARHFKAPQNVKDFVQKKIKKLEKYHDGIINCEVILEHEKTTQIAEISLHVEGQHLHGVEKSEDLFKSIELSIDKMERQLKKYKAKRQAHSYKKVSAVEPDSLEK